METTLAELRFGDLEAFDEASNHPDYFRKTFVTPDSMNVKSLKNSNKYIVVGRKGVGKTALQMNLAEKLRTDGYLTCFFSFHNDLKPTDYSAIAKTQTHITIADVYNERDIFLNYDFRDVWERTFLVKIAEELVRNGFTNLFTSFVIPENGTLRNIFEGITKALSVKLAANIGAVEAEVNLDLSEFIRKGEIPLDKFNAVARKLLVSQCPEYRLYLFIDELVFSKLDAKEDEIRARAAMVRDIIRVCRNLNNFAHQSNLDYHLICSLRPEIRNMINDLDAEVGKIIDGKDVHLSWVVGSGSTPTLLSKVFELKIIHSHPSKTIDFNSFVTSEIKFGRKSTSLLEFLKTNTWGRPRDLVRLLNAISKTSPNSVKIGQAEIKGALNEYSRTSTKELMDELSVKYGELVQNALKAGLRKKRYDNSDRFWDAISNKLIGVSKNLLLEELFLLGVIGNFDKKNGNYYWAHRESSFLKPDLMITVHPGLWNEFGIRGAT